MISPAFQHRITPAFRHTIVPFRQHAQFFRHRHFFGPFALGYSAYPALFGSAPSSTGSGYSPYAMGYGYGSYGMPYGSGSYGMPSGYNSYANGYSPYQAPSADEDRLPSASASERSSAVVSVLVDDDYYQPTEFTVAVGTTVRWTNYGKHAHTITSDQGPWGASEKLRPGDTFSYTFNRPGTYGYHCTIHPQSMRGIVVVE
jgi:plastocyanin